MASESKRQQRFAGIIQQDLADIFQREGQNWFPGSFITVTKVRMTPDLAIARIYLSFLESKTSDELIKNIRIHSNEIRYKLGAKIKNQARIVPSLEFFVDDTNEYVSRMDRLFEQISKESRQDD
ncbi:30S ribosome-binding factor RbfA [Olivibacter sitiensis]|uniref:30S ribosome-binding factor RbfA n=1 Tax=Olivibacter sitiensis TaxID=376470 RepID=UPI0003F8A7F7|nr:30S ribosome-binding factor RbfA [Olivibacter sitiensis]